MGLLMDFIIQILDHLLKGIFSNYLKAYPFILLFIIICIISYILLAYRYLIIRNEVDLWNKLSTFDRLIFSILHAFFTFLFLILVSIAFLFLILIGNIIVSNLGEIIVSNPPPADSEKYSLIHVTPFPLVFVFIFVKQIFQRMKIEKGKFNDIEVYPRILLLSSLILFLIDGILISCHMLLTGPGDLGSIISVCFACMLFFLGFIFVTSESNNFFNQHLGVDLLSKIRRLWKRG